LSTVTTGPAVGAAVAVTTRPRRRRFAWWAGLFLLPSSLLFAGLVLLPIVVAVVLSFCSWDGTTAVRFIGTANWQRFLGDGDALAALQRTGLLVVLCWLIQEPIALALGVYAAGRQRHRALLSAVYFLPALVSSAALGVLWSQLLSPVNGGVQYASQHFGLPFLGQSWLGSPHLVLGTVTVLVCWQFIPFHSLIFQAGVKQIPRSLYEAAAIDGLTPWQQLIHITLPMLRHTIVTSSTLNIVGSLTVFDLIYTLTGGGPGQSTRVLALAQYLEGFQSFSFGYASVLAVVLGVLAVVVSLILVRVTGFGEMRSEAEGA
jgi:raffinose/stachyose/melibiose transport system permease protein